MSIDWTIVGGAVVAVGIGVNTVWSWWLNNKAAVAKTKASVADAHTETTVADAQQIVYRMMSDRLTTIEAEIRVVRTELAGERQHNRELVLHIWKLESLMRKANLTPPEFTYGVTVITPPQ